MVFICSILQFEKNVEQKLTGPYSQCIDVLSENIFSNDVFFLDFCASCLK